MDRYTRVIQDIHSRTSSGSLLWEVVRPRDFAGILISPDRVLRAFLAEYPLGRRKDRLLFVERKIEQHDLFGNSSEAYGYELLVLNEEGSIVLEMFDGVVDRADLSLLAGLIAEQNDETKNFFEAFERPGVA